LGETSDICDSFFVSRHEKNIRRPVLRHSFRVFRHGKNQWDSNVSSFNVRCLSRQPDAVYMITAVFGKRSSGVCHSQAHGNSSVFPGSIAFP
jgi:hypothetical protein